MDKMKMDDKFPYLRDMATFHTSYLEALQNFQLENPDYDWNQTYEDVQWSLLHHAANSGIKLPVFDFFLERKIDINGKSPIGVTPLHLACGQISKDNVTALLDKNADPTAKDDAGLSIIHYAAKSSNEEVLEHILALPDVKKMINDVDADGNSPLHCAASREYKPVGELPIKPERIIEILLLNGSNINQVNKGRQTAIHRAILCHNWPVVRYLIEKGANLTLKDSENQNVHDLLFHPQSGDSDEREEIVTLLKGRR